MLKTIHGVTYNTSVDTEIAHWGDALARSDSRHVYQVLYRTHGGDWYMRTRRGEKEDIAPLSADEVQAWAPRKHLTFVLGQHFGKRVKPTPASVL